MPSYSVKNAVEIPTPQLIYYPEIIEENIRLALKIAGGADRLRPHVKSHKTTEIPSMLLKHGIKKFKTATVAESEMLAMEGFKDIFLAYPLVGPNIKRFAELCAKYPDVKFTALIDNKQSAKELSDAAADVSVKINVMVDIDSGMHRTGVPFDKAFELYAFINSLTELEPAGLHVYDGENKDSNFEARMKYAENNYKKVKDLQAKLNNNGYPVPTITMGGTPSFPCYARFDDVELSPGTCFLNDAGYSNAYKDLPFTPAAVVATRVLSVTGENIITFDMGYKAIASDPPADNRGQVCGLDVKHIFQNEEHWTVEVKGPVPKPGEVFYVIPTHICPTSALYEEIAIAENGTVNNYWKVKSRRRKINV